MALRGADGEFAGWVYKQGSIVKSWKKRYMVLSGRQLTYYDTAKVDQKVKPKGSCQVITVELSTDIQNGLLVHGRGGRVLKLYTASAEATSAWYNMILDATKAAPQQFMAAPPDRFSTLSASASKPADDELELLDHLESLSLSEDGSEQVTHSGWLKKEGARVKSWRRRFFVLRGNSLSYFNSEDTGAIAKGSGDVRAVEVNTINNGLDISFDTGRVLRVTAKNSKEMELWLCKLSDAIEAANREINDVRQSLAVRNSLPIQRLSPTRWKQQQRMQHYDSRFTGIKMRHSLASVPSKPRGSVAETPEMPRRRTVGENVSSLSLEDSYLSSGLSSPSSTSSCYVSNLFADGSVASPTVTTNNTNTTHNSSSSTFSDSDGYDSDDSDGDWI
ncbi:3hydroxyisobutyryl hydrolase [Plasmopara halstedii]|uniref:3hydroxyisobutyryl hydrolase n=1 Tax=Plasmopara halstedii TaxID=4781 RepID=A0A0N7L834_PLAHL|nr:3hydroxyisobutyryl hydrolase [Plasmopara halstedii]CEG48763.1 3hydroxyisobutyryl hydrolase [Plasmopara halstedii]|eukprot:XP_024585132.1 3hydroxyisobutyryl hydrolase [Plasmopara halstedii]